MRPKRFRAARFLFAGVWREEGSACPASREPADLDDLAELCDRARAPSRRIDLGIALAVSPDLRMLACVAPGVWVHPDGSRIKAPRYSSSTAAAMSLVPHGHRIKCNVRAAGRIEIFGPDEAREIGWGRNSHFPLAASAAALRARAWLARLRKEEFA